MPSAMQWRSNVTNAARPPPIPVIRAIRHSGRSRGRGVPIGRVRSRSAARTTARPGRPARPTPTPPSRCAATASPRTGEEVEERERRPGRAVDRRSACVDPEQPGEGRDHIGQRVLVVGEHAQLLLSGEPLVHPEPHIEPQRSLQVEHRLPVLDRPGRSVRRRPGVDGEVYREHRKPEDELPPEVGPVLRGRRAGAGDGRGVDGHRRRYPRPAGDGVAVACLAVDQGRDLIAAFASSRPDRKGGTAPRRPRRPASPVWCLQRMPGRSLVPRGRVARLMPPGGLCCDRGGWEEP